MGDGPAAQAQIGLPECVGGGFWLLEARRVQATANHGTLRPSLRFLGQIRPSPLSHPAMPSSYPAQGLVWSTWAVLAGSLLLLALTYNLYPDYKAVESWERRWSAMAHCCFCCISNHEKGRREDLAARLGRIFALVGRWPREGWVLT